MPQKKTKEEFIQLSKKKYGEDTFDYSLCVYTLSNVPTTLICKNGHIIHVRPSSHLSNNTRRGCIVCYRLNMIDRKSKYNQQTFIEASQKVHDNKYDYSKTVYSSLYERIIIICKIHGEFTQKAVHHLLNKTGCYHCGRVKTEESMMLSEDKIKEKIEKFKKIHNNKYTYGKIFREKLVLWLEIICPTHGSHITRFFNHEKGHGCPKCVSVRSNVQIQWLEYRAIRDGFIQHSDNHGEYTIPNTKLCVDGYNKETNTIYEFQGDFWHGNPAIYNLDDINRKSNKTYRELYDKTMDKINKMKSMGYNVVYIWENDWTKAVRAVKMIQRAWRKKKLITA
jgi:hypothetical protein